MLIIRGVNLYPTQVESVLKYLPEFSANYQLIITKQGDLDALEVKVELDSKIYEDLKGPKLEDTDDQQREYLENLKRNLIDKIKNTIGLTMNVSLENYNDIPRSSGGKLNRVFDERNLEKSVS